MRSKLVPIALGALGAAAAGLGAYLVTHRKSESPLLSPRKSPPGSRLYARGPVVAFTTTAVIVGRSKKTGQQKSTSQVVQTPLELKTAAEQKLGYGIAQSDFDLATMMASEAGGMHPLARLGVGWAAYNMASKRDVLLAQLLTPNGVYGSQALNHYASTERPPTEEDIALAAKITSNAIGDPTGGAIQWDSPRLQDSLAHGGDPFHIKDAEKVAAQRISEGMEEVHLEGIDPAKLRFWRPKKTGAKKPAREAATT